MFGFLVSLVYDGSIFFGWAKQPNLLTVQGYIEDSLEKIFKKKISINFFSRLDKGVHALDQKFIFSLDFNISEDRVFFILSKKLKLLSVFKVEKLSDFFSGLISKKSLNSIVKQKEYCYFINIGEFNLFKKRYCWEYNRFLSKTQLTKCLSIFLGTHDFFNFSCCKIKNKNEKNTTCTIDEIKVKKIKSTLKISFKAKRFIRYQIRALIGESVSVCEGNRTIEELKKMLESEIIKKYKFIAPSSGLFLWKIDIKKS